MGNAPEIGDALLSSRQVSLIIFVYILLFVSLPLVVILDKYPYLLSAFVSRATQVRKITFTGSTAVGKKLMAAAAPTVKKVCLSNNIMLFKKIFSRI